MAGLTLDIPPIIAALVVAFRGLCQQTLPITIDPNWVNMVRMDPQNPKWGTPVGLYCQDWWSPNKLALVIILNCSTIEQHVRVYEMQLEGMPHEEVRWEAHPGDTPPPIPARILQQYDHSSSSNWESEIVMETQAF